MSTTQDHLDIADITENIVLLKTGGGSLIIKVSAVNFGLLSEIEQVSIISSFAQMLNSLSFCIQILIQSQRLDVSAYIALLEIAQKAQGHPLLASMIAKYRQFIQSLVKENEVLDKQFYLVITVSPMELGLGITKKQDLVNKIQTVLEPRRDQILRQLGRVGLRADQMETADLVKLFYDIYNQTSTQEFAQPIIKPNLVQQVKLTNPQTVQKPSVPAQQIVPTPTVSHAPTSTSQQAPQQVVQNQNEGQPIWQQQASTNRNHPFVVEELVDSA